MQAHGTSGAQSQHGKQRTSRKSGEPHVERNVPSVPRNDGRGVIRHGYSSDTHKAGERYRSTPHLLRAHVLLLREAEQPVQPAGGQKQTRTEHLIRQGRAPHAKKHVERVRGTSQMSCRSNKTHHGHYERNAQRTIDARALRLSQRGEDQHCRHDYTCHGTRRSERGEQYQRDLIKSHAEPKRHTCSYR